MGRRAGFDGTMDAAFVRRQEDGAAEPARVGRQCIRLRRRGKRSGFDAIDLSMERGDIHVRAAQAWASLWC
jgi:hypothetical protein